MTNALIGKALTLPDSELEFEFGRQFGRRCLRAVAQRLACAVAADRPQAAEVVARGQVARAQAQLGARAPVPVRIQKI